MGARKRRISNSIAVAVSLSMLYIGFSALLNASASPIQRHSQAEPPLLIDLDVRQSKLLNFVEGATWLAEQEAIRSRLLFPKDILQADVPIGPRYEAIKKYKN